MTHGVPSPSSPSCLPACVVYRRGSEPAAPSDLRFPPASCSRIPARACASVDVIAKAVGSPGQTEPWGIVRTRIEAVECVMGTRRRVGQW